MQCPKCTGETRVIRSYPTGPRGEVRRRRQCVSCGNRFSTLEVPIRGQTPMNPLEIGKQSG